MQNSRYAGGAAEFVEDWCARILITYRKGTVRCTGSLGVSCSFESRHELWLHPAGSHAALAAAAPLAAAAAAVAVAVADAAVAAVAPALFMILVWCCALLARVAVADFEPLGSTRFTTDVGWGCMVRSAQMMLAQAVMIHRLGRAWRHPRVALGGGVVEVRCAAIPAVATVVPVVLVLSLLLMLFVSFLLMLFVGCCTDVGQPFYCWKPMACFVYVHVLLPASSMALPSAPSLSPFAVPSCTCLRFPTGRGLCGYCEPLPRLDGSPTFPARLLRSQPRTGGKARLLDGALRGV